MTGVGDKASFTRDPLLNPIQHYVHGRNQALQLISGVRIRYPLIRGHVHDPGNGNADRLDSLHRPSDHQPDQSTDRQDEEWDTNAGKHGERVSGVGDLIDLLRFHEDRCGPVPELLFEYPKPAESRARDGHKARCRPGGRDVEERGSAFEIRTFSEELAVGKEELSEFPLWPSGGEKVVGCRLGPHIVGFVDQSPVDLGYEVRVNRLDEIKSQDGQNGGHNDY